MRAALAFFWFSLTLVACAQSPTQLQDESDPVQIAPASRAKTALVTGRNDLTLDVDGITRDYIVYVPTGYDSTQPTPVVFMFHGTTGTGQKMYNISGWAGKSEAETFISVFPSSLSYYIVTKGRWQTKWNAASLVDIVAPGTVLADDVKFVRGIVDQVVADLNVDESRIYASGHSNGCNFVSTRLLVDAPDLFAAFSGACALPRDDFDPLNELLRPFALVLGQADHKLMASAGIVTPFPMDPAGIMADPFLGPKLENLCNTIEVETAYDEAANPPWYSNLRFDDRRAGDVNELRVRMVKDMDHVYANGGNNTAGLVNADLFWDFFLQYEKPPVGGRYVGPEVAVENP